jgi:mRNA interferase RelE/StbE
MEYKFEKSFARDFKNLNNKDLAKAILGCAKKVSDAKTIKDIPNLKKITGYKSAYRIRTGDYRIGLIIENNEAIFVAFAHRKEIYRHFPK